MYQGGRRPAQWILWLGGAGAASGASGAKSLSEVSCLGLRAAGHELPRCSDSWLLTGSPRGAGDGGRPPRSLPPRGAACESGSWAERSDSGSPGASVSLGFSSRRETLAVG